MKKCICLILLIFLVFSSLPVTVSANGPAIEPKYWFDFTNLPDGTKYVDMLVELPENDEKYVALVSKNLPDQFSEDAPIIGYCEKNFSSYTFHYANAASMIEIDGEGAVYFFKDGPASNALYEHEQDIYERGRICLAMLDESGNILQVSRTFSIKPKSLFDYQLNTFHYDAKEDTLNIDTNFNAFGMFLYVVLSVAGVVFTCFVENIIALPFDLWKMHHRLILGTNILSQVLMRLLHILLYGWVFNRYVWTVVVLEILVYSGEFLIYRKKMKDVSRKRILWYTVTANTASLVLSAIPMMIV